MKRALELFIALAVIAIMDFNLWSSTYDRWIAAKQATDPMPTALLLIYLLMSIVGTAGLAIAIVILYPRHQKKLTR